MSCLEKLYTSPRQTLNIHYLSIFMTNKDNASWVFIALLFVAAFIAFLVFLSKFFLLIAIVLLILGIVVLIFELYEGEVKISVFLLVGCVLMFILSAITGQIASSLAGSSVGQASLQTADAMNQVEDSLNEAYQQLIDEQCKIISQEQCEMLTAYAKTAKTLQDLQSYATKLKKVQTAIEK